MHEMTKKLVLITQNRAGVNKILSHYAWRFSPATKNLH